MEKWSHVQEEGVELGRIRVFEEWVAGNSALKTSSFG